MLKIIKDDKEIFEISNGKLELKFYKRNKNKGKYEIKFKDKYNSECLLKDCFASINFQALESENLMEQPSINYSFEKEIQNINDNYGKGLKIIFNTINRTNIGLDFKIQFRIYENNDFILVKLIDIKDNSQKNLPVHSISPLSIKNSNLWLSGTKNSTNLSEISFFKNGWQSWSPCKILSGEERDTKGPDLEIFNMIYDNQDYKIEGRFYSEYCTAITDLKSKNTVILGFTTLKDQFTRIVLDYDNSTKLKLLSAFGCLDGVKFNESSIISSEELFICFKTQNLGYYGLIDYAKTVKANIEKLRISSIPVGWCSWYYYYTDVTQEDVVKNLDFFETNRDILPIDFMQLDDGYFMKIGDYTRMNSKFQNGLKWLFEKIKNSGFKGGIWTAPFFAVRKSELFKNHREWFLKRSNKLLKTNFNWNSFQFSLDLSNNEVLEYLNDLFNNLLCGLKESDIKKNDKVIEFFKIDFLHAAVPYGGDYQNKSKTRAQLYYDGVKAIREGITDKSFLLGCGAPLGPCVGLVDAMRISYDTGPLWENLELGVEINEFSPPALKIALLNILYRSFMHKYFWINDPDCLMIRRTETKLNIDEIQLQLTIFGLSGGQILISDNMLKLSTEEINDAKLVIPPYNPKGYDPIVVDAFTSKLPSIYMLETNEIIGKRYLVSIINWEEKPIKKVISISNLVPDLSNDENEFYIYDFWNKMFLGKFDKDDKFELKKINPHACSYLCLIPINVKSSDIPILLSTNIHVTQGCCEIKSFKYISNENKLLIDIELSGKRKGSLLIKLPRDKKILKYNSKFSQLDDKENIWELFVEFKDKTSVEVGLGLK
ncbi:MAG: glycoside hydrolase family 36 protein [Promethearchaeota archaeon]